MATQFQVWIDSPTDSNTLSAADLASDGQKSTGFQAGVAASSTRVNSMLRQNSLVVAALMNVVAPSSTATLRSARSVIESLFSTYFGAMFVNCTFDSTNSKFVFTKKNGSTYDVPFTAIFDGTMEKAKMDQLGNVIDTTYATKSELTNALTSYVQTTILTQTLESYVKETDLETKLNSYVPLTTLAQILANYVKNADLNTALASYVTTDSLDETLVEYATQAWVNTTISDYYTKNQIDAKGYLTSVTGGTGISVSDKNEVAIDTSAGTTGQVLYYTGSGVGWKTISEGATYAAGNGIKVENNVISVDTDDSTLGQVLTSNGPSAKPTWQDAASVAYTSTAPIYIDDGNISLYSKLNNFEVDFDGVGKGYLSLYGAADATERQVCVANGSGGISWQTVTSLNATVTENDDGTVNITLS